MADAEKQAPPRARVREAKRAMCAKRAFSAPRAHGAPDLRDYPRAGRGPADPPAPACQSRRAPTEASTASMQARWTRAGSIGNGSGTPPGAVRTPTPMRARCIVPSVWA